MKIQLSFPYSVDWRLGYLQESKNGRKYVVLYNSNKSRTVTSYARYLMAVNLGRYLNNDEEVDHIDENKQNDCLSNLQILSGEKNREKNQAYQLSKKTIKHGTLTAYRHCRCDLCKNVKKAYMKDYKSRRLSKVDTAPAL